MNKRMTGQDYRKEYKELKQNEKWLDVHVTDRLVELGKIHPDAIITKIGGVDVRATCLSKQWVESLKVEERISFIEIIEEWSLEKENVVQLKI